MSGDAERVVAVNRLPIELGPFLKLAGLARSGGEAKTLTAAGRIAVNGEVERRRGRMLAAGDRVCVGDSAAVVVAARADNGEPVR